MIDDLVTGVPQSFRDFLDRRGLVYDGLTQLDLLAATLSSQFLLFAGPSGTGKSTAARVLAEFFVPPTRRAVLDARPAWSGTEDLVGQYSVFGGVYAPGPGAAALKQLDTTGVAAPPFVVIEEANLSPMEGYLGPLVTAASGSHFERLPWRLHDLDGTADGWPGTLSLRPWPRFLGTVNIDSTAPAPAPKVSGRACVVLLEPPDVDSALGSTGAIEPGASSAEAPPGAELIGDPSRAWSAHVVDGRHGRFADALKPLLHELADLAGNGANIVSPRDVQRCVLYMSWHAPLAAAASAAGLVRPMSDEESGENALLHFVLPGLSAEQFRKVIGPLTDSSISEGLLHRRLERLAGGGESLFGVAPDFWASLS